MGIIDKIKGIFSTAEETVSQGKDIVNNTIDSLDEMKDTITEKGISGVGEVMDKGKELINEAKDFGEKAINEVKEVGEEAITEVKETGEKVKNMVDKKDEDSVE